MYEENRLVDKFKLEYDCLLNLANGNLHPLNFMQPDYPAKLFSDYRTGYVCLVVTLAIDKQY